MALSINRFIKSNIYCFFVVSFVVYISLMNLIIYGYYWQNKIECASGKLDYLKDEALGGVGVPINIVDYSSYGPSLNTIIEHEFPPFGPIVLYFFVFIAATLYIIIPLLFIRFDSVLKKVCIVIDILWAMIYVYFFTYPSIKYPLYGFIPMCILAPILLLMMVLFRLKQYKNIRGEKASQRMDFSRQLQSENLENTNHLEI